jgi:ABC-type amino acid transport substrate-binding protein
MRKRLVQRYFTIVTATVLAAVAVLVSQTDLRASESATLTRIKQDGQIRIGMYLSFEGLSFKERGKLTGLEVALADILAEELSKDLGQTVKPVIVDQEWSQIIKVLRDEKYDVVFSALIPSPMYARYNIRYSRPYLDTGPVVCCREEDGKPVKDVTEEANSLADKRVVVINDPAVRRVMRRAGIYVPADEGKTDIERTFPKSETQAEMKRAGREVPLVPVKEILQIDEMPVIYKMIGDGEVDAGVIDLGIIWWVANDSRRWSKKIYAFPKPVGPYIYSAVTRAEDEDLGDLMDKAVANMLKNPKYEEICKKWHGNEVFSWGLTAEDFMK